VGRYTTQEVIGMYVAGNQYNERPTTIAF